jgi:hypothetical protein
VPQSGIPPKEAKYRLSKCSNHAELSDRSPWLGSMGLKEVDTPQLARLMDQVRPAPNRPPTAQELAEIPDSFDARKQWPQCRWLHSPMDQGNCGRCLMPLAASLLQRSRVFASLGATSSCSCWTTATALMLSTRLCVATNGTYNVDIAPQNLLSCTTNDGCSGGYPTCALWYAAHATLEHQHNTMHIRPRRL